MAKLEIPNPEEIKIQFDKKNTLILREPLAEDMIKLEAITQESKSQIESVIKAIVLLQKVDNEDDRLLVSEVKKFPSKWIKKINEKLNELQGQSES